MTVGQRRTGSHATPIIRQTQAAECGLACLAMISWRHGLRLDLAALRRRFDVSIKGMSLKDVVMVARGLQLDVRPVRAELHELGAVRTPCILHWDLNHFVVLERVSGGRAIIHDPARGRRILSMDEISRGFTGVALELWPTAQFCCGEERSRLRFRDMFRGIADFRKSFAHIVIFASCLEIFMLISPIGFQIILDQAIVGMDQSLLSIVVIGLVFFLVMQVMLSFAQSWSVLALQSGLSMQWASGLFDRLTDLPVAFFEKRHTGDIVSRFGSLNTIQTTLTTDVIRGALDGFMAFSICIMMAIYGGWMLTVVLTTTLVYSAFRALIFAPYRRSTEDEIACSAAQQSHFLETVRGISSIKVLALRERRHGAWTNLMADTVAAQLRRQRLDAVFAAANRFLFGLDRIVLILAGALSVMKGAMTVGMLIAFLTYRDQFTTRIVALINVIIRFRMLELHRDRLADIALAQREGILSVPDRKPAFAAVSRTDLEMRDVSFSYGDGTPLILDHYSLCVEQGECVALTGPSGCGKTTVLRIFAGLLEPTRGTLVSGGRPVDRQGLAAYRSQIACVLQEDHLFAGSIAENIAAFDPEIDWDHLVGCARMSAIDAEICQMPMGYETLVGDMGSALSGGQKQRLLLARALYRKPQILLLDEATSHLDEANERIINNAVRDLRITRIMVAHRPSTIALADRVVCFRNRLTDAKVTA